MHPLSRLALLIPPIRRLHDARDQLLEERDSLALQTRPLGSSPLHHYNACFDAEAMLHRHAARDLRPHPNRITNFLGVLVDPKVLPAILAGREGSIEPIPIPANWHADVAEWAMALRAVEQAQGRFIVIELGCGWGCWMNNTGVAARRLGLAVTLIGVEGDPGHIAYAREATAANGFDLADVIIHHGIAAARSGRALFPRQTPGGADWGLEPIFDATVEQIDEAVRSGACDALPMLSLAEIIGARERIDLLHVDIQGGEAALIAGTLDMLTERVAMLLIGTHSRQIEGELFERLLSVGWILEIERPAILSVGSAAPVVTIDGVQGWRNPALLP
ncbi:class I SAM-dependent methyltransferase [Lichenicoccus sp.]|uniref:class I SAM-dependent methyltransferase n=1 Tax=Lichenicoccus sp. TaxID=2781899 RepID=UPI003D12DD9D